ncbi:MAG: ABC transporter substrate-binding protein [Candidatus Promineifilaceae bacterium]
MKHTKRFIWLSVLLILAMVMVACGGQVQQAAEEVAPTVAAAVDEAQEEVAAEPTEAPMEEAAEEPTAEEPMEEMAEPTGGAGYLDRALAGEFAGTVVTMAGPFTDEDEVLFNQAVAPYEEATGIDIQYVGSKEFEAALSVRVDGNDAPDIVDFPQPGLMANFARQGHIIDVTSFLPEELLVERYNPSWLEMATVEGPDGPIQAGVWQRFNAKSFVFYPKAQFEAAGYEVPETWDELMALTQTIASDGDPAWCIGIESGAATGWPATDWTEELMLRTTSLENYDAWVAGELPFSSPEVKNAIETWSEIWLNPDYVFGGTDAIIGTFFGDAPTPMFEDPPQCWLHRQGNFITSFFPEGAEYGTDFGVFYFPPVDEAYGKPFLVAGDIMSMFNDRDEVRAVMEYFTTPDSSAGWLQTGGAFSPHLQVTPDMYPSDLTRDLAAMVDGATSFRFDASDLMPGEVGSGTFWTGMTDYVSGSADLDTVLADIDASWPSGVAGQVSATEEEAPVESIGAGYLDRALAGEFDGAVVTMAGPFTDEDEVLFNQAVAPFEEETGIDIQYVGSKEFEAALAVRVDGNDAPDIVDFPQPGLMANFARQGHIIDVTSFLPEELLVERYNPSWLEMATVEGPDGPIQAGVWQRFNAKSFVFYPKAQFEAAGYEVPETWDELMALTQTIASDGDPAWCIGIESGAATGWPATDWTEELMLRTTSLENYDAWVAGELPFSSPEVKNAIETWSEIWLNPDYVFGGTDAIIGTFFGDAPTPMFEDPPQCWLHRQGNFITSFFPEGAEYGTDFGVFYFPPVDEAYGKPFLVAGDIMSMFNDRDEVRAVMEYFTTPDSSAGWLQTGGAFSPHLQVTPDMYPSDLTRDLAAMVDGATSFRFDASDLMPGEVGSGTFWTGMTDYVSGSADLDTVLADIDASWPQ